jgi:hypothetical protein
MTDSVVLTVNPSQEVVVNVSSITQLISVTPPLVQQLTIDRGIPGPNELGGYPVVITNAQQSDLIMFKTGNWVNINQLSVTDGGNF